MSSAFSGTGCSTTDHDMMCNRCDDCIAPGIVDLVVNRWDFVYDEFSFYPGRARAYVPYKS